MFNKPDITLEATRHSRDSSLSFSTDDLEAAKSNPWAFTHFTNVPKLGIFPNRHKKGNADNSPVGIYGWPADLGTRVPYAQGRRYAMIFEVKPEYRDKILIMGKRGKGDSIPGETLTNMIRDNLDPSLIEKFEDKVSLSFDKGETCSSAYNALKNVRMNTIAWNKLFRTMGFEGVYDNGSEAIWPGEPRQAVFFSKASIRIISMIDFDRGSEANKTIFFSRKLNELMDSIEVGASLHGKVQVLTRDHMRNSFETKGDIPTICTVDRMEDYWTVQIGIFHLGVPYSGYVAGDKGDSLMECWNKAVANALESIDAGEQTEHSERLRSGIVALFL